MLWSATDFPTPENADHLTRQHVEADVFEDDHISKCLGDVLELDIGS